MTSIIDSPQVDRPSALSLLEQDPGLAADVRKAARAIAEKWAARPLRIQSNAQLDEQMFDLLVDRVHKLTPISELEQELLSYLSQQNALKEVNAQELLGIQSDFLDLRGDGADFNVELMAEAIVLQHAGYPRSQIVSTLVGMDLREHARRQAQAEQAQSAMSAHLDETNLLEHDARKVEEHQNDRDGYRDSTEQGR
jgi:hypothetical protein